MQQERGITRRGYLVLLLFLAILGYLSYRIIPVYLDHDTFDEGLRSLAGKATRSNWDNRRIVRQVTQLAERNHFKVERKDIRIQHVRGRQEVGLEVEYSRTEEFPGGYAYVFHFHSATLGSYWF